VSSDIPDLEQELHPLDAATKRDPVPPTAGVLVVVLAEIPEEQARAIGEGLSALIRQQLRPVEVVVENDRYVSRAERLSRALAPSSQPLVLITTATQPWTDKHLKPLFDTIHRTDHAIGKRRLGLLPSFFRWIAARPCKLIFAAQAVDPHSPCQLHRREPLIRIPLQSASSFLDIEILGKAAFLTQLVEEVLIPDLPAAPSPRGTTGDLLDVFLHPKLKPDSGPLEDPKSQQEGADGPGSENQQVRADIDERGPLEDDKTQSIDELRQR
jgi:hypothetical protein